MQISISGLTPNSRCTDFYSTHSEMVCDQEPLDMTYYEQHKNGELKHIHETLVKMDVAPLLQIEHAYYSELIARFYCTLCYENDAVRSMTWMSGEQRVSSNLPEFIAVLGYSWKATYGIHGYKVHDDNEFDASVLYFCYPPGLSDKKIPFNSHMYPFYNLLSKIFRRTIMIKAGDKSAIRAYMVNLMHFTKPNRQKKIDVMDFMFTEITLGTLEKRKPAYGPYIQKLINAKCGEHIMERFEIVRPNLFIHKFIPGPNIPEFAKLKVATTASGSSSDGPRPPPSGIAKFFKAMFQTCSDARSFAHDAKEMAKETRRIQNADRRAAGFAIDVDPPELAAVDLVHIPMPLLSDADFYFGAPPCC